MAKSEEVQISERVKVFEELQAIAKRYRDDDSLKALSGILYCICGVLAFGDLNELCVYMMNYPTDQMNRIASIFARWEK